MRNSLKKQHSVRETQIYKETEKRDVLKSNLDNYLEERSHGKSDISFDTAERKRVCVCEREEEGKSILIGGSKERSRETERLAFSRFLWTLYAPRREDAPKIRP